MGHGSNAGAFFGGSGPRERIVEVETPVVMDHGSGSDDRLQAADGCMGEKRGMKGMRGLRGLRREMEEGREWGSGALRLGSGRGPFNVGANYNRKEGAAVSLRLMRWLRLMGLMRWLGWLRWLRWLRWVVGTALPSLAKCQKSNAS